jgi:hypothetical protein
VVAVPQLAIGSRLLPGVVEHPASEGIVIRLFTPMTVGINVFELQSGFGADPA